MMNFTPNTAQRFKDLAIAGQSRTLSGLPLGCECSEQRAIRLLNRTGCRQWPDGTVYNIGYWPDLDGPELRGALRIFECAQNAEGNEIFCLPLTDPSLPAECRERFIPERCAGEPLSSWFKRVPDPYQESR
jgi:hypothetical protein